MAVSVAATGNAVVTASRSPSITFSTYTPATNDVIAFFAACLTIAAAATAPSGWVLPTPAAGANPVASDSHTYAFTYHLVTAGEAGGSATFTATNLWNATVTGNVTGIVLRGVDAAVVVDSLASGFSSVDTVTPHVFPALTGSNLSDDSLIVNGVAKAATGTYTTPTNYTARGSNNTNQANNLYTRIALVTEGTNIAVQNITPSAGDEYCTFSVAFAADIAIGVHLSSVGAGNGALNPAGGVITWSHTVPAGTNQVAWAGICSGRQGGGSYTGHSRSVTFGGQAMTEAVIINSDNNVNGWVALYYLLNPPTGTQTVSVTVTTGSSHTLGGGSLTYVNYGGYTNATTQFYNFQTPLITVVSAVDSVVLMAFTSGPAITGINQTSRYINNFNPGANAADVIMLADAPGAASVASTATPSGDVWGIVAVSLTPATAAAAVARSVSIDRAAVYRSSLH